jgi:hypothetical protein
MKCASCEVRTEFICYIEESRPPLWSSGQNSWLQIQRPGFDPQLYQIFWEVIGLERGTLSLVSTIEEILERKSSGSGLETRDYCRSDPSCWPRDILYLQTLALSSPIIGGLELQPRSRPASSRSLYRLRYRGFQEYGEKNIFYVALYFAVLVPIGFLLPVTNTPWRLIY